MNNIIQATLWLIFCCVFFNISANSQTLEARQLHNKFQFRDAKYEGDYARIVIKFHDGSGIRSHNGLLTVDSSKQDLNKLKYREVSVEEIRQEVQVANTFKARYGLDFYPQIKVNEDSLNIYKEIAEKYWRQEMPEMQTYLQIPLKDYGKGQPLKEWVEFFRGFEAVEIVYAEPLAEVPNGKPSYQSPLQGFIPPTEEEENHYLCTNIGLEENDIGDLSLFQEYRGLPPEGINADAMNLLQGGQGEGVRIIDIESGYYGHADHPKSFTPIGKYWVDAVDHGNHVIGIISALHNDVGVKGIASQAEIGFRSILADHSDYAEAVVEEANVANHVFQAAIESDKGVVLMELQRRTENQGPDCVCRMGYDCTYAPMEYWPAEFDTIKLVTGNDVVVVEASANGSRNLDGAYFDTCGGPCFNREFRDSGAILVAGSHSDGVTPVCGGAGEKSNYGSRIDVHSWGEDVVTTTNLSPNNGGFSFAEPDDGSDRYIKCNKYTNRFNGSSSASAIIAGAAATVQSLYMENWENKMEPWRLRTLLWATGTPQVNKVVDGHNILIGTHPDLGILSTMIVNGWWPWWPNQP